MLINKEKLKDHKSEVHIKATLLYEEEKKEFARAMINNNFNINDEEKAKEQPQSIEERECAALSITQNKSPIPTMNLRNTPSTDSLVLVWSAEKETMQKLGRYESKIC